MSATRRSYVLNASEMRAAVLGHSQMSMAEKPIEKEAEDRQLREEYERLLRQLDRKPTDSPQPGDVPPAKPENSRPSGS